MFYPTVENSFIPCFVWFFASLIASDLDFHVSRRLRDIMARMGPCPVKISGEITGSMRANDVKRRGCRTDGRTPDKVNLSVSVDLNILFTDSQLTSTNYVQPPRSAVAFDRGIH